MNSYWLVHASAQSRGQNQWDIVSRRCFETDSASWHSCSIWKRVFIFSRTVPHHTAVRTKDTVVLQDQETPDFIPPALWLPNLPYFFTGHWCLHKCTVACQFNLTGRDWLHIAHCQSRNGWVDTTLVWEGYKKLSYHRETARQLPTWRGARPSSPLHLPLWLHLCVWSNPKPATNVRQAFRPLSAF